MLENFKLSEKEEGGVVLSSQDIRNSQAQCDKSLVGKIFGGNTVNLQGLKQTMSMLWCLEGSLKVIELKNKMYQFVFSVEDERKRVLEKRPWTFENQVLVLHPWRDGIVSDAKAFLSTQIWVQAWNIPAQWLSSETVWKIGTLFNQCSNVIISENGSKEGRYAKLLVEIDLTKPLIRGSKLRCNGEMQWIMFRYENLPFYCFYCGMIGHGERLCDKKMSDARIGRLTEGEYGDWLRALNIRGSNKGRSTGKLDLANSTIVKATDLVVGGHGKPTGSRLDEQSVKESLHVGKVGEGGLNGGSKIVANSKTDVVVPEPAQVWMAEDEGVSSSKQEGGLDKVGEDEVTRQRECGLLGGAKEMTGVLMERDLNVVDGQETSVAHTKGSCWKRRVRKKTPGGGSESGSGKENVCGGSNVFGKRVQDAVLIENCDEQSVKRAKMGEVEMTLADSMVEVASHNWPQVDQ